MQRKTVSASLKIQIMVECPNCESLIDLLDPNDCSGWDHNEEGRVICQAVRGNNWHESHKDFNVSGVQCTECDIVFDIKGLEW